MFVLDFDGAFDEFSNTTYGAVDEMIPEVMLYDPFVDVDKEVVEEAFAIWIDPETFFIDSYHFYGKGQGVVDEEDYELITTIVARLSNINDVDAIVIPDDVVANAVDESGASVTE